MVCLEILVSTLILLNSRTFVDGFEGRQKSTTYLKKFSMKDKLKMLRDYYNITNYGSGKFGKIQLRKSSMADLSDMDKLRLTTLNSASLVDTSGLYAK